MDLIALARTHGHATVLRLQNNLIRRDQALAAGIAPSAIDSLVRRGRWERLLPRVFAVDVDPMHPTVRVRAAWLWAGEDAVIGGHAAAWWSGLRPDPPGWIHVLVPPNRRMTPRPNLQVVRTAVAETETMWRDRVRVTSPDRTCLDLARQGRDAGLVDALRMRRVTPTTLAGSVDLGRGRRGQVRARAAVDQVADNPWSVPERDLHQLFRQNGITGWRANAPVTIAGRKTRYPDVRFDEIKLLVEIDGRTTHDSSDAFDSDHSRQNDLIDAGWTVLRFTARQVYNEPAMVVRTVRRNIDRLRGAA